MSAGGDPTARMSRHRPAVHDLVSPGAAGAGHGAAMAAAPPPTAPAPATDAALFDHLGLAYHRGALILDARGQAIDFVIRDANAVWSAVTGLALADAIGRRASALVPDLAAREPVWLAACAQAGVDRIPVWLDAYHMPARAGQPARWFDVRLSPVGREGDREFLAVATDITDRVQAHAARESALAAEREARAALVRVETRYRLATEAVAGYVYEADLVTGVVEKSGGFTALTGFAVDDPAHTETWWRTRLHPDDLARLVPETTARLADPSCTAYTLTYRVQHADGAWRWLLDRQRVVRDADGVARRLIGAVSDITAEREADARAAESRRMLRRVLDELFAFVGLLTPDGTLLEANRAPLERAGLTLADVRGRPFWMAPWWAYDPGVQRDVQAAVARAAAGEAVRYDVPVALGTDEEGWPRLVTIDFQLAPLRDAAGRVTHLVPSGVDVSQRVAALALAEAAQARAEAERQRAETANAAKAQFLATMSHELRTPLNAIGGYAELLALGLRGPVTPEQREDLARIQKSQRHLLGLINGVLNYARLEAGAVHYDITDVPVAEVLGTCEALVAPQARGKGLMLVVEPCAPSLTARADREKVQQVVLNLLSNAVKFTEAGGVVTLACAHAGDHVVVQVRDSGIGIPPAQQARIFEPFVQVDATFVRPGEGTGLGLAISRDLARGMGGDLGVVSAVGAGSTFTLTLPVAASR